MCDDTLYKVCPECGSVMERRFTPFAFHRFQEHFNPTVGKVVTSKRSFADELKRAGEEQTARTGIPNNYVPVEIGDMEPKNLDGLEAQNRRHRELGTPGFERKKSFF